MQARIVLSQIRSTLRPAVHVAPSLGGTHLALPALQRPALSRASTTGRAHAEAPPQQGNLWFLFCPDRAVAEQTGTLCLPSKGLGGSGPPSCLQSECHRQSSSVYWRSLQWTPLGYSSTQLGQTRGSHYTPQSSAELSGYAVWQTRCGCVAVQSLKLSTAHTYTGIGLKT